MFFFTTFMHIIDQYAYANRIRTVEPAHKAGLALTVLALCLLLNRPLVGLLAVLWMGALVTLLAGLPARVFGRVLLAQSLFLSLATLGVAVGLGLAPAETGWNWQVGPVWVTSSPQAVDTSVRLASRAIGAAAAMNFLALTTPLVDLVDLMRRWFLPPLLIDLVTLIYRFIFTLLESSNRIYTAQASRLGYAGPRQGWRSAGLLGSRLFIDAYHRSRRLQLALDSRGYNGVLLVLPSVYRRDKRLLKLGAAAVVSLLLGWIWG